MSTPIPFRTSVSTLALLATVSLLPFGASGCRDSAPDDLIQQESTTEALVFVRTKSTETLNRSLAEGNLMKLSPISPDGIVTPITNFTGASVSDPAVSFDGAKILFSMRPSGGSSRNVYEINADGTGLRQVTSGGGDDFDPLYLPDGRVLFTSTRSGEMDEYNHARSATLYTCDMDGSNLERISFNQSDDFDPELLPNGKIVYTRWEHFGDMNRFPLFVTNPDGSGTFHQFGPHERNFFHSTVTPEGRLLAIESTRINGDEGPLAVLKPEQGPSDPASTSYELHWDVVTPNVNTDGEPWSHGAFKYPRSIGGNRYVVSYSLPAATREDADYGLYTFTLDQAGAGTVQDPATFSVHSLTFLFNDPEWNEYDAQLLAPHSKPPVIASTLDRSVDYGIFLAQDVFNRSRVDGQEVPVRGVEAIDSVAVIASIPTTEGMANNFSANNYERRALIGMVPVHSDGSFRMKVPANTPLSFATLDSHGRGIVVKRTHIFVRPGERFENCVGCHEDRVAGGDLPTNPNPMAAMHEPFDINIPRAQFRTINYLNDIGPIVTAKCVSCHQPNGDLPAPGGLDLTAVPDTAMEMRVFPRGYINLSGASRKLEHQVVSPGFPRRSRLVDYALGLGSRAGQGSHPAGADSLTAEEKRNINLWVLLGAQYR
ncbi:MAG: PD40 domain-containing protein [Candidatus Eisenbacteria bacterium]|nr:PD40 domain-containing protein [Candidatus Eisenbacteria bacterium]